MAARPWLRHPAREIRPRRCPTGLARHSSRNAALWWIPATLPTAPTPLACTVCGGWHLPDTPPDVRHQPEGEPT
jgi:hypothetical protein